MKMTKKQLKLIGLFGIIHFFMPFALVKCGGEDVPYIKETTADESASATDDCASNEFLTKACADKLDEEAKKAAADAAAADEAANPEEQDPEETPAPETDTETAPPTTADGQVPASTVFLNHDFTLKNKDFRHINLNQIQFNLQNN